ncbi:MAG: hypothetical protein SGILL_007975, partial [Bacillariaceae sp.]
VKFHMKASFAAEKPLFKLGKKKVGVKLRKKEFLNTHIVGDTAFFEVEIPTETTKSPTTADEIFASCVRSISLGDSAVFFLDVDSMDPKASKTFQHKLHKGHYKNVAAGTQQLFLEIDSFRIVRTDPTTNLKIEHHRQNRNGTGASMPGSFGM